LCQVLVEDGEDFFESKPWWSVFLAKEVVMLSLLKVVINLVLEALDPFNQSRYMICLRVGGIYLWRCSMKNMKGSVIIFLDWVVWRHPHRWRNNICVLFYNMLLLDRKVLGQGCSGFNFLLLTFWRDHEEAKLWSKWDYFAAFFCQNISQNYLWYLVELTQ